MIFVEAIFEGLWQILSLELEIMGYKFNLWNLVVYFVVMYILLSLVFNYKRGGGEE